MTLLRVLNIKLSSGVARAMKLVVGGGGTSAKAEDSKGDAFHRKIDIECVLGNLAGTPIEKELQPRSQSHLFGRGEEIDDPGKGCPSLLVHWLTHSTSQGL